MNYYLDVVLHNQKTFSTIKFFLGLADKYEYQYQSTFAFIFKDFGLKFIHLHIHI